MESIQKIRELEKQIIDDAKQVNSIIAIRKYLTNENESNDVRMASLHALRRIFIDSIDNGRFNVAKGQKTEKIAEYVKWLRNQFTSYQESLLHFVSLQQDPFHAPAIRTIMEFVKREYKVEQSLSSSSGAPYFGITLFQSLLSAIVGSTTEVDIDLLLMLKEEVFEFHDCTYYGFVVLRELIQDTKDLHVAELEKAIVSSATTAKSSSKVGSGAEEKSSVEIRVKNLIDLLRILTVPSELQDSSFLVATGSHAVNEDGEAQNSDGDSDSSDDEKEEDLRPKKGNNKRSLSSIKRAPEKKAKKQKLAKNELVYHLNQYRKVFSKAWLSLLSLPLTIAQHKLLLKHLPEHVMGVMANPLLLADYLTQSYDKGGAVAVLSLESLFTLIATYNLDYPNFFLSLYNLCTVEVFSAKYRNKFMKLLNMSLKSINLPAYLVAAFIKRLAFLSLHTPSTNAPYCVGQIAWLLRNHPQTQLLIHRSAKKSAEASAEQFDNSEETNLENSNALKSSLWELEVLEKHHLYSVATVVNALKDASSTAVGRGATSLPLEQFLDLSYADMLEDELNGAASAGKKGKRNAALAYKKPEKLFKDDSLIRRCFGSAPLAVK